MKPTLLIAAALAMPQLALAQPSFVPLAGDDSIVVNMDDSPLAKGEMWQRCAEGQQWSGGTCTGTATLYGRSQRAAAVAAANAENGGTGRGGYNDWREPDRNELYQLHLPGADSAPYTHRAAFPETPSAVFWTATDVMPNFVTLGIDFGSAYADANIMGLGSQPLRLVRGNGIRYTATATAQPPDGLIALTPTEQTQLPQATGTTFTVTPQPGWQVDSASTSATDGSCKPIVDKTGLTDRNTVTVLNMQSDCAIAITLARIPGVWRVIVQPPPAEQGRIDCPATVSDAAPATCTAQPEPGWELAAWGGDCAASASGSTCTLANQGRDAAVSARFISTSALAVTSPHASSAMGEAVTFTATLSGAGNPTGAVTFHNGTATLCEVPAAPYTCTATLLAGTHSISAAYAGDGDNSGATSPPLAHQVNAASVPITGGTAAVGISGPAGCMLDSLVITAAATADNLPQGATAPLGVLRFTATGCPTGAALAVQVSYPPGSLTGLSLQKYGPHGGQTSWFGHGTASGDVASYTVTDGGDGDSNPADGAITDPFAPLRLAAGLSGVQAVPTLSQWGLLLMTLLLGLAGASAPVRAAMKFDESPR